MDKYDIVIGNKATLSPLLGYKDIVLDRSSVLGNPFELEDRNDFLLRSYVVSACSIWIWRNLLSTKDNKVIDPSLIDVTLKISEKWKKPTVKEVREAIYNLVVLKENIRLICWCNPKECHLTTIKKIVELFRSKIY